MDDQHAGTGHVMFGLFENVHAVMLLIDPATGTIVDANPAACAFYGWGRDELRGKPISHVNTLSPEEIRAEMDRAVRSQNFTFHFTHRRADGSERAVEVRSGPVEVEGASLLLSIVQDVTERNEAQADLQRSEWRLRRAEEVAGLGHYVLWLDRGIVEFSDGACRLYGLERSEMALDDVMALFPEGADREAVAEFVRGLAAGGAPRKVDYRARRLSDGTIREFQAAGEYDPEARTVFGVIHDVTDAREAAREIERHRDHLEELVGERTRELREANEALVAATAAKDRFLANVSHELRTPLNSIIGFSGLLLQGVVGPLLDEQHKQVGMINRSGRLLLSLIEDILDLSTIGAGGAGLEVTAFDPVQLVSEVLDTVFPMADGKGLTVSIETDEAPASVLSDRRKVRQVLLNLVGNAVKFTAEGQVTLRVERDDRWVRFLVRDTGSGIDPRDLDSIFEPFVQVDRAEERIKPEGAGLGLTISREYARLLGGDVEAVSGVGEGSTFVLRLPADGSAAGA